MGGPNSVNYPLLQCWKIFSILFAISLGPCVARNIQIWVKWLHKNLRNLERMKDKYMSKSFFFLLFNKEKVSDKNVKRNEGQERKRLLRLYSLLFDRKIKRDPQKNYTLFSIIFLCTLVVKTSGPCSLTKVFQLYLLPHVLLRFLLMSVILKCKHRANL